MSAQDDPNNTELIALSDHEFDGTPTEAIVTIVAELTEQSPLEMEPLAEVIDPDALNRLFDRPDDRSSSVTATFDYCGQQIIVTHDGIKVAPPDDAEK